MLTNTRSLQIEWGDCDPAGIIFYPRYFAMFDHSTNLLIAKASGVNKIELLKRYDAGGFPALNTQAKFIFPTTFGDDIQIESTFTKVGRSSFEIRHLLSTGGKLAVEAMDARVWVKRDPDDKTKIRSHPLPDELAARFRGE